MIITLPDYERIFRVIYSVIEKHTKRPQESCICFAVLGASILKEKYKIEATPVAGAAAFAVHAPSATVATYGQIVGDDLVSTRANFHCWIEAQGVAIDFMAPLFREAIMSYGHDVPVARRMFQKPLSDMSVSVTQLRSEGSFFMKPNTNLGLSLFNEFCSRPTNADFLNICLSWYVKPPKLLATNMGVRDEEGNVYMQTIKGPSISGSW